MIRIEGDWTEIQEADAVGITKLGGRGWTLIAVVQELGCSTSSMEQRCPGGPTNGGTCIHGNYSGCCHSADSVFVPVQTSTTKYVLGRRTDAMLGDLGLTIEKRDLLIAELRDDLAAEEDARQKDARTISELQAEVTREAQYHEEECANNSALRARATKAEERASRIEADVGKLRKEIGSLEVRRILGPENKG